MSKNKKTTTKKVKKCTQCDGSGYIYVQSHDCWGRDESYYKSCVCSNGWIVVD